MRFEEAYKLMRRGEKIKLPEWGGYWYWDFHRQTIMIQLRQGGVLDIRETSNVDYTFRFICRDDWQVIE